MKHLKEWKTTELINNAAAACNVMNEKLWELFPHRHWICVDKEEAARGQRGQKIIFMPINSDNDPSVKKAPPLL